MSPIMEPGCDLTCLRLNRCWRKPTEITLQGRAGCITALRGLDLASLTGTRKEHPMNHSKHLPVKFEDEGNWMSTTSVLYKFAFVMCGANGHR